MRFFQLVIEYDGRNYNGWQIQLEDPTVQATLERAIQTITRYPTRTMASGRTDAGVHALGQVVAARCKTDLTGDVFCRALNANLPADVRVLSINEVKEDFHPIRDSLSKRYRYLIQDGVCHDVFRQHHSWFVPGTLDVAAMQSASVAFRGTHDFASMQSSGSERKTTVRTISDIGIEIERATPRRLLRFEVEADGFLYNMVRNIVGTLVEVGQGRRGPDSIADLLRTLDRRNAGMTAPPQGLFLVNVTYPESIYPATSGSNDKVN